MNSSFSAFKIAIQRIAITRWLVRYAACVFCVLSSEILGEEPQRSRFEIFGGYSVAHATLQPDVPFASPSHVNAHGFNIAGTVYFTPWLGAVADFSGHFSNKQVNFNEPVSGMPVTEDVSTRVYPLQFGPQVRFRAGRVTPFARVMFGWFRRDIEAPTFTASDNDFGFSLGGGVDVRANERFAIRIGQADYIRSHLTPADWQNNFRFSAGVVLTY